MVLMAFAAAAAALSLGFLVASVGMCTSLAIALISFPKNRVLAFFGAISYSLYLVHVPVGGRIVNLGSRLPATLPWQLTVLTVAVAASVAAAYALYIVAERPAQRWSASVRYSSLRDVKTPRHGQLSEFERTNAPEPIAAPSLSLN